MKRCPTCNRTYADAALSFCTADGTPLVDDAPAYQQTPAQPPPYQAPAQQYYPQQGAPQMSYGQQPARRRKGFAIAALLCGLISSVFLLAAALRMGSRWGSFRYGAHVPADALFWAMFVVGFLLLLLAALLGLIGLIQSFRNPARYGGKALAFLGPFLGVLAAALTVGVFSYARVKAPSTPYPSYSYNSNAYASNANTSAPNGNTYSANANTYSANANASAPKSSAAAMSEDDKYRLFYAASKTGDQKLILQAYQKIGLFDQNGRPTPGYQTFIRNSVSWAFKDTEFIQTINTPEKAREYVMSHL